MRAPRLSVARVRADRRDLWYARGSAPGRLGRVLVFSARPTRFESGRRVQWAAPQDALLGSMRLEDARALLRGALPENDRECVRVDGTAN